MYVKVEKTKQNKQNWQRVDTVMFNLFAITTFVSYQLIQNNATNRDTKCRDVDEFATNHQAHIVSPVH